jgi:hypothetical protein
MLPLKSPAADKRPALVVLTPLALRRWASSELLFVSNGSSARTRRREALAPPTIDNEVMIERETSSAELPKRREHWSA